MLKLVRGLMGFSIVLLAFGQSFDVISVKPAAMAGGRPAPRVIRGGPGSTDPGTTTFESADLFSILTMAFDIRAFQLAGPDWLRTTRFDITAKVPAGTTIQQYRMMLRNLLADRFRLSYHLEKKEGQVYELIVGKDGSKLKESEPGPAPGDDGSIQPPFTFNPPQGFNGSMSVRLQKAPIAKVAGTVSAVLGQPVTDATGLTGRYDVVLQFTVGSQTMPASDASSGAIMEPGIIEAVSEQLGLRVVAKKGTVDLLVIDHIEKTPTAN